MYSVTVLTPSGRRQQVKVTPNTTLLQILEEVCVKHGFNAEEYDLRHHNKVLDVSSMFRFTSLPNNAQLEMTEAIKQRQESPVTLGLQFESGERLTGQFIPSDTIWNVIVTLKPEEEKSTNLVVIYMRQEVYGKENLKATTLRSLGLTSGRAMLRLLHKSPEELHIQANVSANLTRSSPPVEKVYKKPLKSPELVKAKTPLDNPNPQPSSAPPTQHQYSSSPEPIRKEAKSPKFTRPESFDLRENVFQKLLKDEKTRKSLTEESHKNTEFSGAKASSKKEPPPDEPKVKANYESKARSNNESHSSKAATKSQKELKEERKVILLGDRSAVAYNLNSIKPMVYEEEPDDFFDLTVNDAKLLYRQAKQLCADLEDAPLMTAAQRELEKDKKMLSLLHQYKKTVLRVHFPDRTVLQGTFSPVETVSAVEKFVTAYLENPKHKFYLYTTPPKVILNSGDRLIECGCVPCSVLYFGLPAETSPPSQYLKTEVLGKLSTPSAAALTAYESRGVDRKLPEDKSEEAEKRKWSKNSNNSEPGTSGEKRWENKPKDQESSPQLKVPKWFKTTK